MTILDRPLIEIISESLNVRNYGVKGDGVTDDTTALNALAATGKSLYFPQGVYLTSGIEAAMGPERGQGIKGDGQGRSVLQLTAKPDSTYGALYSNHRHNGFAEDITFAGGNVSGVPQGVGLLNGLYAPKFHAHRCEFRSFDIGSNNIGNDASSTIACYFSACNTGLRVEGNQDRHVVVATTIVDCLQCAVDVQGNGGIKIEGGVIAGNYLPVRLSSDGASANLSDIHFEGVTSPDQVYIQAGNNARVVAVNLRFADGPVIYKHFTLGYGAVAQINSSYATGEAYAGPVKVDSTSGKVFSSTQSALVSIYGLPRVLAGNEELRTADDTMPDPTGYPSGYRIRTVANGPSNTEATYERRLVSGVPTWVAA